MRVTAQAMNVLSVVLLGMLAVAVLLLIWEVWTRHASARAKQLGGLPVEQGTEPAETFGNARVWTLTLTVVSLAIVAHACLYPQLIPSRPLNMPVYLPPYNFGIGLILLIIFNNTIGRWQGRLSGAVSFIAIFGSLIVSDLISESQRNLMKAELETYVPSVARLTTDSNALSVGDEKHYATKARGDYGKIERIVKIWFDKLILLRVDYDRDLDSTGLETILDPGRLARDSSLIESKLIVQKATDIAAKYKTWMYVLTENAREEMSHVAISKTAKLQLSNEFDYLTANWCASYNAAWDLEARFVAEIERTIALLSSRRDVWRIQDGSIWFVNETDLRLFNSYMASIEDLRLKAQALPKQSIEDTEK
jgi:hypothetical protein